MNKQLVNMMIGALSLAPISVGAASWSNRNVGMIQASYSGTDCFYFKLEGVSEADPVAPGSSWFAMSRNQPGAREAFATLLTAKVSGMTVNVTTDGSLVCGYPKAHEVYLP